MLITDVNKIDRTSLFTKSGKIMKDRGYYDEEVAVLIGVASAVLLGIDPLSWHNFSFSIVR